MAKSKNNFLRFDFLKNLYTPPNTDRILDSIENEIRAKKIKCNCNCLNPCR